MRTQTFFEKVRKMRENQRAYFKTRAPFYKDASIKLEKEVDAELDRRSPNIFGEASDKDSKMLRQTVFWLKAKRGQMANEGQSTEMIDAVIAWNEEQLKAEEG